MDTDFANIQVAHRRFNNPTFETFIKRFTSTYTVDVQGSLTDEQQEIYDSLQTRGHVFILHKDSLCPDMDSLFLIFALWKVLIEPDTDILYFSRSGIVSRANSYMFHTLYKNVRVRRKPTYRKRNIAYKKFSNGSSIRFLSGNGKTHVGSTASWLIMSGFSHYKNCFGLLNSATPCLIPGCDDQFIVYTTPNPKNQQFADGYKKITSNPSFNVKEFV